MPNKSTGDSLQPLDLWNIMITWLHLGAAQDSLGAAPEAF